MARRISSASRPKPVGKDGSFQYVQRGPRRLDRDIDGAGLDGGRSARPAPAPNRPWRRRMPAPSCARTAAPARGAGPSIGCPRRSAARWRGPPTGCAVASSPFDSWRVVEQHAADRGRVADHRDATDGQAAHDDRLFEMCLRPGSSGLLLSARSNANGPNGFSRGVERRMQPCGRFQHAESPRFNQREFMCRQPPRDRTNTVTHRRQTVKPLAALLSARITGQSSDFRLRSNPTMKS